MTESSPERDLENPHSLNLILPLRISMNVINTMLMMMMIMTEEREIYSMEIRRSFRSVRVGGLTLIFRQIVKDLFDVVLMDLAFKYHSDSILYVEALAAPILIGLRNNIKLLSV